MLRLKNKTMNKIVVKIYTLLVNFKFIASNHNKQDDDKLLKIISVYLFSQVFLIKFILHHGS